jgi:hypothetical protein
MQTSPEDISALLAVCIRCGQQGAGAGRCGHCGGIAIQTRQGQVVRDSAPELSRSLHLPGIDDRHRFARGTQPPDGSVRLPVPAPEPLPDVRSRLPVLLMVAAVLISAGLAGLLAAVAQTRF